MERENNMARPNNIAQVTERYISIATVELDELATKPALMKAYVALVEAAEKAGGMATKRWGTSVEVKIAKSIEQIKDQLDSDQRSWDSKMESYKKAARGEFVERYMRSTVKEFAEAEGLPEPEFVEQDEVVEV
jgi:hypothetical protein